MSENICRSTAAPLRGVRTTGASHFPSLRASAIAPYSTNLAVPRQGTSSVNFRTFQAIGRLYRARMRVSHFRRLSSSGFSPPADRAPGTAARAGVDRRIIESAAKPMLPFKLVYSDDYYLPIGAHVFPAEKYRRIHDRLLETGVAETSDFVTPQPASDQDVLLVHTPAYVHKLKTGTLSAREELEMEVPYSPELVGAFWMAAGGSILAADYALQNGVAFNIGGGFHHAFPDHGEGFCMIHDVAVAIRRMQRDDRITRAMTVDCDVHQGNGTAAIFAGVRVPAGPLPSTSASTLSPAACEGAQRSCGRRVHHLASPGEQLSDVGSRRRRSISICPTGSVTVIIWHGSTTRSARDCAS